jgi:hypothetical protein
MEDPTMETLIAISIVAAAGIWGVSRIISRLTLAPPRGTYSSGCDACGCATATCNVPDRCCGDEADCGLPRHPDSNHSTRATDADVEN